MAKLKDMLGIEAAVEAKTAVMKKDLYKAIKEIAEMQYKQVELDTKLSNLEALVKSNTVKP